MDAVHATVFPLDGEGAAVADVVQGDDDFFEVDVAVAEGAEIPVAARVTEADVAAEDADGAVTVAPPDVLHVGVEDAGAEGADELHVVDALVAEVGRVVVEPKTFVAADGLDRALGAGDVEGDLGGVNFEGEVDVGFLEGLEDGAETFGEVGVTSVPVRLGGGREGVNGVPDGRTREAVDDGRVVVLAVIAGFGVEEGAGGFAGGDHLLGGALADALGVAVAPDIGGENGFVALVDVVTDGLADQVAGDGVAGEAVVLQHRPFFVDVFLGGGGDVDIEVVAPAGEFDAIVAHFFGEGREFFEGEVGPLAGEQRDWTWHRICFRRVEGRRGERGNDQ